jgi:hypothetical protein
MVQRYRPIIADIEAVQLCWRNWNAVCELLGDAVSDQNPARQVTTYADPCGEPGPEYIELTVPTYGRYGPNVTRHGDWILRLIDGEPGRFSICTPEEFASIYVAVDG